MDTSPPTWARCDQKDAYLSRLRRVEGQVRGLQRMIDEDQYCIEAITPVSAVAKALQSVALRLVEDFDHRVRGALWKSFER